VANGFGCTFHPRGRRVTSRIAVSTLAWLAVVACAPGPVRLLPIGAAHAAETPSPVQHPGLPPSEDAAKDQLNRSPRHGEFVNVVAEGTPVRTWVVYPERKDKAPVVVVIHEIFGLSDWIRAVADQLAAEGFIAVAPDLLSSKGPGGGGTDAFATRDDAVKAVSGLARSEVIARLNAVRSYALALPSARAASATVGFCWGGSTSFAYAVAQPLLHAAVVYYGTPPEDLATLAAVKAPVLGLYGGDDARVDATIEATQAAMRKYGKSYEPHVFEGAGHGFLRAQAGQNGANLRAAEQAWPMTVAFLRRHLR
jgi:carboxymethylenebutenolidase